MKLKFLAVLIFGLFGVAIAQAPQGHVLKDRVLTRAQKDFLQANIRQFPDMVVLIFADPRDDEAWRAANLLEQHLTWSQHLIPCDPENAWPLLTTLPDKGIVLIVAAKDARSTKLEATLNQLSFHVEHVVQAPSFKRADGKPFLGIDGRAFTSGMIILVGENL